MIKAAKIAELLMNKEFTTTDMFKAMLALKLSRLAYSPKFDSMVDLIGYTEGWHNYINDPRFKVITEDDIDLGPYKNWNPTEDVKSMVGNSWPTKKQIDEYKEQINLFQNLVEVNKAIQLLEGKGYRIFGPEK